MKISSKILIACLMLASAAPVVTVAAEAHGVEATPKDAPLVKVAQGRVIIEISGEATQHVAIYALTGQTVKQLDAAPGVTSVDLPAGMYIVRIGHHTVKVVVK